MGEPQSPVEESPTEEQPREMTLDEYKALKYKVEGVCVCVFLWVWVAACVGVFACDTGGYVMNGLYR